MKDENIKEESEIQEALKKPFDYGSEEYLSLIKRIHKNREKYRNEQTTKQILKYKFLKENKNGKI